VYDLTLKVQYVEIYNDSLVDLLAADGGAKAAVNAEKLTIRERPGGEVGPSTAWAKGLTRRGGEGGRRLWANHTSHLH